MIVGAGAGGSVLAQRLARHGLADRDHRGRPVLAPRRGLGLRRGRLAPAVLDPEADHRRRADPIEMGKNNSGRGVGGSMVHYAGYCPRFHPSDFETLTLDGVGADWPISYHELKPHYEELERELPVAGQDWPWGDPHTYPFSPHPVSGGGVGAVARARSQLGIEMRVGPVGIVNGTFGNRPHCIYRGYCLQGCKVNAKASPYVTHLPDALAHGVEIRADSMAIRVEIDESGRRASASPTSREDEHRALAASRGWWPWPATRSRRHACCSTRPHPASRTASATTRTRSAAT